MGDLPVQKPALKLRSAFFKVRRDETDNHSFQDFKWVTQQGNRPAALGHFSFFCRFQDYYDVRFSPYLREEEVEAHAAGKESC